MSETDWYLLDRAGRRYGPYDWPVVDQLVREQELQPDTPVWHPGLARWRRADAVLTMEAPVRREAPSAPVSRKPATNTVATARPSPAVARKPALAVRKTTPAPGAERPTPAAVPPFAPEQLWQRALAAAFDLLLVAVVLQGLSLFILQLPPWVASPRFALLVWALAEGWLLANTGRTPGKALFAIAVRRKDGAKFDERSAWLRSGAVPLLLLAMTLGAFFALIGVGVLMITLGRLRTGQPAWWDQFSGSTVTVGEFTPGRKFVATIAFAALVLALLFLRSGFG
ncbi:MAG: RDD family protein [Steroidobacteraceae bacterium]